MAAVLWPRGQRVSLAWFSLWRKLCGAFVSLRLSFVWCPPVQGTHHAPTYTFCYIALLPTKTQNALYGNTSLESCREDIVMVPFQPTHGLRHSVVELQSMNTVLSFCTALFCEPNGRFSMTSYSFGNSRIPNNLSSFVDSVIHLVNYDEIPGMHQARVGYFIAISVFSGEWCVCLWH